jgi:hypothetical protein
MPQGFFVQLLILWTAAWTLFTMKTVVIDAGRHAVKSKGPTAYAMGAFSLALVWVGAVIITSARLDYMYRGVPVVTVNSVLGNIAFVCFIVSGWLACRVGLPGVLWHRQPWAWRIYNIGAVSFLLIEALN